MTALEPVGYVGGVWTDGSSLLLADATAADPTIGPFTYTYTDATTSCVDTAVVAYTINALPVVTIADQTICADVTTVDLTVLEPVGYVGGVWTDGSLPAIAAVGTSPTVCSGNDGYITISGLTAGDSYTVSYTGSVGTPASGISANADASGEIVITGLVSGTYTNISVIDDATTCLSNVVASISLIDPNAPAAPIASGATYCSGDVIADVTATGAVGATFTWYSDAALMTVVDSDAAWTPSGTVGTETVYVTQTVAGCESAATQVDIVVNVCDCTPTDICSGTDLVITKTGYSTDPGFALVLLLTDANGIVQQTSGDVVATGTYTFSTTSLLTGSTYNIYALSYDTTNPPSPLTINVGDDVDNIGTTMVGCYNSNFLSDRICYTVISCCEANVTDIPDQAICEGNDPALAYIISPFGGIFGPAPTPESDYSYIFYLTDPAGNILQTDGLSPVAFSSALTSHTPDFDYSALAAASSPYRVYIVVYNNTHGGLSAATNVNSLTLADGDLCLEADYSTLTIYANPVLTDQVVDLCPDTDFGTTSVVDLTTQETAMGASGGVWYSAGFISVADPTAVSVADGDVYTYIYTNTNNCADTATVTYNIGVCCTANVTDIPDQTLCEGSNPSLAYVISAYGGIFGPQPTPTADYSLAFFLTDAAGNIIQVDSNSPVAITSTTHTPAFDYSSLTTAVSPYRVYIVAYNNTHGGLSIPLSNNINDITLADGSLCLEADYSTVNITNNPVLADLNPEVCEDVVNTLEATVDLTTLEGAIGAAGGVWSIGAIAIADPTSVLVANGQVFNYTYSTAQSCSATATVTYTVYPQAIVNAGGDATVCYEQDFVYLTGASIGGGATTAYWQIVSTTGTASAMLSSSLPTTDPASILLMNFSGSGTITLELTTNDPVGPCPLVTDQVVITVSTPMVATVTSTPTECGANTGSITVTNVSGGNGSYQYSIDGGSTYQVSASFSNLPAGSGTVTIQDALGCTVDLPYNVADPTGATVSASSTDVTCNGATDGTITETGNGGSGSFAYMLGATSNTTGIFSGLGAGNYTIDVMDIITKCTYQANVTIGEPTALIVDADALSPLCAGQTGSIVVVAVGGTAPYTIQLNALVPVVANSYVFNNLTAGTYSITVTDDNGCTVNVGPIDIVIPADVTASANATPITCNGGTSTITVTASGGTGSLSYALDGGIAQATNIFSNVSGGSHSIVVTDSNGCTQDVSITINEPTAIVASAVSGDILCNGATTTITVSASGGTSPLSYSLDGGASQSSSIFMNVSAGSHQIRVSDANGCYTDILLDITEPSALSASANTGTILCNGGTTLLNVSASGGSGSLEYSINNGGIYSTNSSFSVGAGSYDVVVRDDNGCTYVVGAVVVTEPALLSLSASATAVSCNGGMSTITASATGGTGVLTYTLDGTTSNTTGIFSGVSLGTHTVEVVDGNACSDETTVLVSEPTAIVASAVSGDILCNGGTTTITVSASGGTSPLSYSLDGGASQSSSIFMNVSAGSHQIRVSDANGCYVDILLDITEPSALTASASTGTILCNGGTTLLNVSASGGSGSLEYSIDNGGIYSTNSSFSVGAGSYDVVVRDDNGCTYVVGAVVVTEPALLSLSASATAVSCNGGTSTITASATGGTGVLTYTLDGTTSNTTGIFSGVSLGTHTVEVVDGNACSDETTVLVSEPTAIVASAVSGDILCNGATTTITVSASGGTSPLSYSLDGGASQSSSIFMNVSAGSHQIRVSDANGCYTDILLDITEPSALTASANTRHDIV
ncbi:MAG: hypothetical protein IPL35_16950 [Sphingobacteriales bacterium]|nr:hypothetical protein [Sphingobacteriales bacterium]